MPSRAWWSRHRTFVVVVLSLLLLVLLIQVVLVASGTGDGRVDVGPIETAP